MKQKRINWENYFMTMAFIASQRSIDPDTKCGCIITSKDNRLLSSGYNGPIRGIDDSAVPLTRPEKYDYMLHSEINAIMAYDGSHHDIQNAKCYITTYPCHECLRALLQKGISEIYYCDYKKAACVKDPNKLKASKHMIKMKGVKIKEISYKCIIDSMLDTIKYIQSHKE